MKRGSLTLPILQVRMTTLSVDSNELRPGTCGIVRGVAMKYNVVDAYGTLFRSGSLDKTRARASAGKVKLFDNHGMADWYGTRSHIGTVRSLTPLGDEEQMEADLFDTEEGRRCKEYLAAVMASGSETGLSIGFHEVAGGWEKRNEKNIYVFTEVALDEVSLAPRNAVPGADVTGVRNLSDETRASLAQQLQRGMSRDEWNALYVDVADDESQRAAPPSGSDELPAVSMDERLKAYRRSFRIN